MGLFMSVSTVGVTVREADMNLMEQRHRVVSVRTDHNVFVEFMIQYQFPYSGERTSHRVIEAF